MKSELAAKFSSLRDRSQCRFRIAYRFQGCTFGIAAATSTSRSKHPATSPSRTQASALHQSSYPRLAEAICSGCGLQVTGQARISTVRHLPRVSTRSVPTTWVTARTPCWFCRVSTGTQRGTTPGIQSGVGPARASSATRISDASVIY